jgi:nicotinamide riboside kinase
MLHLSRKKIVITGPECSGKTTLAMKLSAVMKGVYIPEVARPLLTLTNNQYLLKDLLTIAKYQSALEQVVEGCGHGWIICDTSMLVIKIWSQYRFKEVDPLIEGYLQDSSADLWLLCEPLTEWHPDILRDAEQNRDQLFKLYHDELVRAGKEFLMVPNLPVEERLDLVYSELHNLKLL